MLLHSKALAVPVADQLSAHCQLSLLEHRPCLGTFIAPMPKPIAHAVPIRIEFILRLALPFQLKLSFRLPPLDQELAHCHASDQLPFPLFPFLPLPFFPPFPLPL